MGGIKRGSFTGRAVVVTASGTGPVKAISQAVPRSGPSPRGTVKDMFLACGRYPSQLPAVNVFPASVGVRLGLLESGPASKASPRHPVCCTLYEIRAARGVKQRTKDSRSSPSYGFNLSRSAGSGQFRSLVATITRCFERPLNSRHRSTLGCSSRRLIGHFRPWASGQTRSAMRRLPAAHPLMAVNVRLARQATTAADPKESTDTIFRVADQSP